jgi:hypothetical protein
MDANDLIVKMNGGHIRYSNAVERLAAVDEQAWKLMTRIHTILIHRFDSGKYDATDTFDSLRRLCNAVDAITAVSESMLKERLPLVRNEIGKAGCSAGLYGTEHMRGFFF